MTLRTLPLLLLLLPGCVGKGKYNALEAALTEAKTENADLRGSLSGKDQELEAAKEEIARLEAQQLALKDTLTQVRNELAEVDLRLQSALAEKADLVKTKARLSASIEEMTQALDDLAKRKAEAERRVAEFRDLVARFQELIDAGKLEVKIIDGRMVVQLATDVLFGSGSASLSADGRKAVREVADVLKAIPDRSFQVEGHTDNVPISNDKYKSNWELAAGRSITVVKEMLDVGMPATRISAASYAEFAPVAPNRTDAGKAQNRRIQIVLVPDLSTLPGFEELEELAGDGE